MTPPLAGRQSMETTQGSMIQIAGEVSNASLLRERQPSPVTKCPPHFYAGAAQSYIGCRCRSTRGAAATVAHLNTSSPSAATTTSGRERPAALSNH